MSHGSLAVYNKRGLLIKARQIFPLRFLELSPHSPFDICSCVEELSGVYLHFIKAFHDIRPDFKCRTLLQDNFIKLSSSNIILLHFNAYKSRQVQTVYKRAEITLTELLVV